jgi:hypothetical protein
VCGHHELGEDDDHNDGEDHDHDDDEDYDQMMMMMKIMITMMMKMVTQHIPTMTNSHHGGFLSVMIMVGICHMTKFHH